MTGWLFGGGILVACFVASNVGGSTTGPAFGPAVGADAVSKPIAAGLMSICFFAGPGPSADEVVADELETQAPAVETEVDRAFDTEIDDELAAELQARLDGDTSR